MGRQLGPKCKLCRREGTKLYLKGERCNTSKCAVMKRNYAPGLHGPKQAGFRARLTGYGQQLREKQKAKKLYHLFEKQFRNYFESATHKEGDTGQNFLQLLEMRLDNVIYKAGWAGSVRQARQFVGHAHFLINGKKVNIPSYSLRINDVVTVKEKSAKGKIFVDLGERLKNHEAPGWLFCDIKEMSIKVVDIPQIKEASLAFDMKSIIEFYSR